VGSCEQCNDPSAVTFFSSRARIGGGGFEEGLSSGHLDSSRHVTLDGVWNEDWIYWPLQHTTREYI
jgi:hypothetical protein